MYPARYPFSAALRGVFDIHANDLHVAVRRRGVLLPGDDDRQGVLSGRQAASDRHAVVPINRSSIRVKDGAARGVGLQFAAALLGGRLAVDQHLGQATVRPDLVDEMYGRPLETNVNPTTGCVVIVQRSKARSAAVPQRSSRPNTSRCGRCRGFRRDRVGAESSPWRRNRIVLSAVMRRISSISLGS